MMKVILAACVGLAASLPQHPQSVLQVQHETQRQVGLLGVSQNSWLYSFVKETRTFRYKDEGCRSGETDENDGEATNSC